jgi:hypothetical protein
MDYQAIFALTLQAKYCNFEGKTFNCKKIVEIEPNSKTTINDAGIELFFSTGHAGRGKTISITAVDNKLIDLELFDMVKGLNEFPGITENELMLKLKDLI